jgi:predicted membrane protein (TIGR00267 family)
MHKDRFILHIMRAKNIFRRYSITNGFDGALTTLGMLTGFYATGMQDLSVTLGACIGAAIALFMSGVTSAYLSEKAEREKELHDLEQALLTDLQRSDYGHASRYLPMLVALVNGLSPLLISLIIISPLLLARSGYLMPISPFLIAIFTGGLCMFTLGIFLGKISNTFWLLSGMYTLVIAVITVGLIMLASYLFTW